MKIKQTILAATVALSAAFGLPSCGDDDVMPIYLTDAENNTELTSDNLTIDAFSEGEKFIIQGGKGNYSISVTDKSVITFHYDGDTLTLLPLGTGTSETLIADRAGNSLVVNVSVENPSAELSVTETTAEVTGDDLTQEQTRNLQLKIAEEGVALAGGRFVFTFADKEHSTGDVKIYPEATGNYKVGIFTRMTKYDEDTGESYDCIQIRMADSTDGKLTFHITGSDTEYVFREDVTDQYRGSYPALEDAARIYRLKKTVG